MTGWPSLRSGSGTSSALRLQRQAIAISIGGPAPRITGRWKPAAISQPATSGPITAPTRPMLIEKPVPVARTGGKDRWNDDMENRDRGVQEKRAATRSAGQVVF